MTTNDNKRQPIIIIVVQSFSHYFMLRLCVSLHPFVLHIVRVIIVVTVVTVVVVVVVVYVS